MITLIYSSQSRMAQSALKQLLDKEHPERSEYNFVSLDMGVTSVDELVSECELHSLCLEKKVVVADNCYFLDKVGDTKKKKKDTDFSKLEQYVNNEDPETDLYILVYVDVLDLSNPIIQAIKEKHRIREVKQLTPGEWLKYINSYFVKRGYQIDQDSVNELYTRTNGDYSFFLNEADKLMSYKLDEKLIEYCDILEMVPPKVENDVFKMSNCLTNGDVTEAIKIYKDLKSHSTDEVTLIGILATQFIFYDKVLYLYSKGLSADEIAKELNQRNPGRIYMTLKNIKKLSSESINRILEQLYIADSDILSYKVSGEFAFSRFLANFSL